jgi:hypothetical protein
LLVWNFELQPWSVIVRQVSAQVRSPTALEWEGVDQIPQTSLLTWRDDLLSKHVRTNEDGGGRIRILRVVDLEDVATHRGPHEAWHI